MSTKTDGFKTILILLGWFLAISFAWLKIGSTSWDAIDIGSCKPTGLIGNTRAMIQGHKFYADQVKVLDSELANINKELNKNWGDSPELEDELKKLDAQAEMLEAQTNAEVAKVAPELAVSNEEVAARKLHKAADELERKAESKRAHALLSKTQKKLVECRAEIANY